MKYLILFIFVFSFNLNAQTFTKFWEYNGELEFVGDIDNDGTIEFLENQDDNVLIFVPGNNNIKYTITSNGNVHYRNLTYERTQPFDFNKNGVLDLVFNTGNIVDPSTNEILFNFQEDGIEGEGPYLFGPMDYDGNGILDIFVLFYNSEGAKSVFYSTGLSVTSIAKTNSNLPNSLTVAQNYPNPFNPSTKIDYSVQRTNNIQIRIYNSLGQLVKSLVDETKSPGEYSVIWNGKDDNGSSLASGVYFYQITTKDFVSSKKMILLK